MKDEIKEILDKLSNRKQETLMQGIRECQQKDIEHPFITKEEYIDKILDYITTLQEENKQLKVKSEVLEENNKLLIQQKAQMYEDLDIAYEKIDKAIEYIKTVNESSKYLDSMFLYENYISNYGACELLDILQGDDK